MEKLQAVGRRGRCLRLVAGRPRPPLEMGAPADQKPRLAASRGPPAWLEVHRVRKKAVVVAVGRAESLHTGQALELAEASAAPPAWGASPEWLGLRRLKCPHLRGLIEIDLIAWASDHRERSDGLSSFREMRLHGCARCKSACLDSSMPVNACQEGKASAVDTNTVLLSSCGLTRKQAHHCPGEPV